MKPVVYYHANCADGYGAAFAVQLHEGDIERVPVNYGPESLIKALEQTPGGVEDRTVYVVDFSFPLEDMRFLCQKAEMLYWYDHHTTSRQTARQMLETDYDPGGRLHGESDSFVIVHDESRSGAVLTFEELMPTRPVPVLYHHLDDYDRWQFKWPQTKAYTKALWSCVPWTPELFFDLLDHYPFPSPGREAGHAAYMRFVGQGEALLRAHNQNVAAVVRGCARECRLLPAGGEGLFVGLVANCPAHLSSDVGHALANRSGTFGLLWWVTAGGEYACSLRSNGDYDVSLIAKSFGGGGHKNASGFTATRAQLIAWGCL